MIASEAVLAPTLSVEQFGEIARRTSRITFVELFGGWVLVGPAGERLTSWSYHTGTEHTPFRDSPIQHVAPDDTVFQLRKAPGRPFATTLLIGRAPSNDIRIDHASVSKLHARLLRSPEGGWLLGDARSRNGTYLDHKRVFERPRALCDGVRVSFGMLKYRFLDTAGVYDRCQVVTMPTR